MALALIVLSCAKPYVQNGRGVIVKVQDPCENGPRLVRLEVVGDKIVHVSATPERKFADPQSLVVLPQEGRTGFDLVEEDGMLVVETSALKAVVSMSTGEVRFEDKEGNVILAEQEGGGKTFEPIRVEGTSGYTFRQVFDSPEDEAFYGLGQHQADEFNYKGKNEQLFQYNTKVSVPFIVSSKGYGVLMDSYSMMRFGNPDDYKQIGEVFTLYDAQGRKGSLTGTYVAADGNVLVREEPQLYFEHLIAPEMAKVVNLPEDFQFGGAEVVYEGFLEAPGSGE